MLELKQVSKSFGAKKVIDQLDLTIEDGSILAVVGPSGGGKTTLLRTLAGLETIDSGSFLLDGKAFDPIPTQKTRTSRRCRLPRLPIVSALVGF